MISKVLLLCSTDATRLFDYSVNYFEAMSRLGGNSGNLIFLNAVQKYLENETVTLDLAIIDSAVEFPTINDDYDACIINTANWIAANNGAFLQTLSKKIRCARVPVYFIGLGAQSFKRGNHEFLEPIRDDVKALIGAVLDGGGGFGLRGYFTAEIFEALGCKEYSVTGCPSMFQMGRELKITNTKVSRDEFKPLVNGDRYARDREFAAMYRKYPKSEFLCQDTFYKIRYCASELTRAEKRQLLTFPEEVLELLKNGRVLLYADFHTWFEKISDDGFNFSFGSRVHGSFAAVLAGIPAFIHATDSRTEELAEFFDIPYRSVLDQPELYELYLKTDYSKFNQTFSTRFDNFCDFLKKHKLPLVPGRNQMYESRVSKLGGNPPPPLDSAVKQEIDDYLEYVPSRFLFALRSDKRFWFLFKKSIKGALGA